MWVRLRCGVEPRPLAALAVVLALAVAGAGWWFWSGRPEPVRPPELVRAAVPLAPGGPAAAPQPPSPSSPPVLVDVAGKVRRPGVVRLPAGSRVADALRAAGGVRPGTGLAGLNQARLLSDGEQIVAGASPPPAGPVGAAGPAASGGGGTAGAALAPTGPLSLSTASVGELDTLPGVGPVLAQHIVDYRTAHGSFRSVDELREVDGIGARRFEDLRPRVRP